MWANYKVIGYDMTKGSVIVLSKVAPSEEVVLQAGVAPTLVKNCSYQMIQ